MKIHTRDLVAFAVGIVLAGPATGQIAPNDKFAEVQEYLFELPDLPAGAAAPSVPTRLSTASDYPLAALRRDQTGVIAVRFRVLEDGSTADAEIVASGGDPLLEQGAIALIDKRGRYMPAHVGGMPQQAWVGLVVKFILIPASLNKERLTCYSKPVIGFDREFEAFPVAAVLVRAGSDTGVPRAQERWIQVDGAGTATLILQQTDEGWRRIGSPEIDTVPNRGGFPKPTTEGGCWYFFPTLVRQ